MEDNQNQSASKEVAGGVKQLFSMEPILNLVNEMVVITDLKGFILYVNNSLVEATGYSLDEIKGKRLHDLVDEQYDSNELAESIMRIRHGDVVEYHLGIRTKAGKLMEISISFSPHCEELEEITHYVGISRDLSHEHELHKQLHELQRMEVLGSMAQGITRGFNDILTTVDAQVKSLDKKLKDDPEGSESLKEIQKATTTGHEMIAQIKAFVRKQDEYISPIEIASVMRQAVRFVENTAPANIQLNSKLPDLSCAIMGITEEVHQILLNLMTNSIEAMASDGGVLEVSLSETDYVLGEPRGKGSGKSVACVKIKISDNGCGIRPEDEEHIFEPYFTTKKSRDAVGMGLTIVRSTVERYRGQMTFYSAPDQGATFEIYLPIHISDIYAHNDLLGPRGNGERILLVDNEAFVTQAGSNLLFGQGYQVSTLNVAEDVRELFEEDKTEFEILIVDMNMEGITGLDLVRELREGGVTVPVILTSPLGAIPQPWETEALNVNRVLPKPCPARDLTIAVRNILDGPRTA